jgi:hypothetical protein
MGFPLKAFQYSIVRIHHFSPTKISLKKEESPVKGLSTFFWLKV